MEYSYELFPQLDTISHQNMIENQRRNTMFYPAGQGYYYYQQQMPPRNTNILDSEDILFPSTVNQQAYPVYNNQIMTATSSLKDESSLLNIDQQQQGYYTYNNPIDMSILTPPTEAYDVQQLYQQPSNVFQHTDPLPIIFDNNQIKVESYNQQDTKPIYQPNHQRQTSLSSISSPSSCFSSVSSFVEDPIPSTTSSRPTSLYQCEYKDCTKTFTRTYNLKSHRRTHTDEKPFACNVCPKAFARQHDRNRHAKLHLGLKPYPCQFCDKSFARQDALNRHLKRDKKGNIQKIRNSFDFPPPCLLIKLRQKSLKKK
jgi:uncharacterized Zn-finger protein